MNMCWHMRCTSTQLAHAFALRWDIFIVMCHMALAGFRRLHGSPLRVIEDREAHGRNGGHT